MMCWQLIGSSCRSSHLVINSINLSHPAAGKTAAGLFLRNQWKITINIYTIGIMTMMSLSKKSDRRNKNSGQKTEYPRIITNEWCSIQITSDVSIAVLLSPLSVNFQVSITAITARTVSGQGMWTFLNLAIEDVSARAEWNLLGFRSNAVSRNLGMRNRAN